MGKRDKSTKAGSSSSSSAVSLVIPSLYLGPCSAASSKAFISANAVTHVLSVGATPTDPVDGVTYQRISISDSPSSSITKVCDTACEIIDAALSSHKGQGKILVHCSAGISRSPMVVAAYLMRRRGMSLREALGQIIQVRPQVSPNSGFLVQLKELEMELRGEVSLDVDELPKREKDRLALLAAPAEEHKSSQPPLDVKDLQHDDFEVFRMVDHYGGFEEIKRKDGKMSSTIFFRKSVTPSKTTDVDNLTKLQDCVLKEECSGTVYPPYEHGGLKWVLMSVSREHYEATGLSPSK